MKENIGSTDRIIRIILGLVLISIVFIGPQTAWGWIGAVSIVTALLKWCPAYSILGINTCSSKKDQS